MMVDLGRQPFYQRLLYFSIKTTDLSPPCDLQHHGEMGSVDAVFGVAEDGHRGQRILRIDHQQHGHTPARLDVRLVLSVLTNTARRYDLRHHEQP
ncbi:hypothetical protein DQ384_15470 [Sphaerisporangium album]|uniref:Uncharacterized protein n=1 Tax=Sphaerisporangium album TaxID=509200 RepID=A0A367FJX5_9ACTN|nr:hypothetical protein DQ384_15470 [Sphaerisporangium album]